MAPGVRGLTLLFRGMRPLDLKVMLKLLRGVGSRRDQLGLLLLWVIKYLTLLHPMKPGLLTPGKAFFLVFFPCLQKC